MKPAFPALLGIVCLLTAAPAAPHHSFAAEFDVARPVEMTGSVTRIEWTNPHAWYFIEVKGADGAAVAWAIELLNANGLMRLGWTRDTVKIGDVLTIRGFGSRDGTNTANAAAVIRAATGEVLYESKVEDRD